MHAARLDNSHDRLWYYSVSDLTHDLDLYLTHRHVVGCHVPACHIACHIAWIVFYMSPYLTAVASCKCSRYIITITIISTSINVNSIIITNITIFNITIVNITTTTTTTTTIIIIIITIIIIIKSI